jgi:hypothetical protein
VRRLTDEFASSAHVTPVARALRLGVVSWPQTRSPTASSTRMNSPFQLSACSNLPEAQGAALLSRLAGDLWRLRGINVVPLVRREQEGERGGEGAELGQFLIAFHTGGAATALIGCLRSYVERDPTFSATVSRADGATFEISAKSLGEAQSADVAEQLARFAAADMASQPGERISAPAAERR